MFLNFLNLLRYVLPLLMVGTIGPQAHAADEQTEEVRIGFVNTPGYFHVDRNGNFRGMAFEYAELLATYAGKRFKYESCTPDACYERLYAGKLDALINMPREQSDDHAATSAELLYSRQPVAQLTFYLSESDESATAKRLSSALPAYGFLVPSLRQETAEAVLENAGLRVNADFTLSPYQNYQHLFGDLRRGLLDGVFIDAPHAGMSLTTASRIFSVNTYFICTADNSQLHYDLDAAAAQMLADNPVLPNELFNRYLRHQQNLVLSDTEYNFLRSHPKLRVAVPDRQSLYAKAGPQGDFNGALRQVLDNLAHSLFLECEYLPEGDAKSALDAVQNGQADLAAECLYDQNVARTRHVRLTPPYYIMNFVMLERRDSTVALSPRVACLNEFYVDTVLTGIYSPEQLRRYDSYAECLKAVASGQADLTFVPSIEVSSLLEQEQIFNLHIRNAAAFNYPVSLAIPESANPLLMSALCKAVNHLDPQQISPLLLDAAQVQEPRRKFSLRGFIYRHPVELLLALLATVVIVALLILLYLRLRGRSQRLQWQLLNLDRQSQEHNLLWFDEYLRRHGPALLRSNPGQLVLLSVGARQFQLLRSNHSERALAGAFTGLARQIREAAGSALLAGGLSTDINVMHCLCRLPPGLGPGEFCARLAGPRNCELGGVALRLDCVIGGIRLDAQRLQGAGTPTALADLAREAACDENTPFHVSGSEEQQTLIRRQHMESLMSRALEQGQFQMLLQPKYDLRKQTCIGAEALVRWSSPELGELNPDEFVRVFERNGQVLQLDYFMLEEACALARRWREERFYTVPLSVNQSGLHVSEPGYLEKLREISERYRLPPDAIELEITETALINYATKEASAEARRIIDGMHELHFSISLDDFCTGYSSLALLQRFPTDTLKIDRAILLEAENSVRGATVLKEIIGFGKSLGMKVICEGVETAAQEELLLRCGCHLAQGFKFAEPMSVQEFEHFLKTH